MNEPEQKTLEKKESLEKLLSETVQQHIFNQFIKERKSDENDNITYTDIPWTIKDVECVLKARPIPVEEIAKKAQSRCKDCNSRGYIIKWVDKSKTSDPENYIVLADVAFKNLSEEEKKIWVERQKQSKTWKIALPCICAMRRYLRSQMDHETSDIVMYTPNFNIVMRISYEPK